MDFKKWRKDVFKLLRDRNDCNFTAPEKRNKTISQRRAAKLLGYDTPITISLYELKKHPAPKTVCLLAKNIINDLKAKKELTL